MKLLSNFNFTSSLEKVQKLIFKFNKKYYKIIIKIKLFWISKMELFLPLIL